MADYVGKPMQPNDGDGPCVFRHTRHSGGKVGTICGRPETDHCPEKFGAHEDDLTPCKKVHHPYHRARAKERRTAVADLYTSFATSVALRDAGAPQGDGSNHHWRVPGEFDVPPFTPWLGTYRSIPADVRAFRSDEIIEAIRADAHAVDIEDDDEWVVRIYSYGVCRRPYEHESLVEALAAAWLAVLKEVPRD